MRKEWDGEQYVVVDTRRAEVLAHHALVEIRCDHERGLDMPVCNCAVVSLGWHENVQEAKLVWARHALSAVDAADDRKIETNTQGAHRPEGAPHGAPDAKNASGAGGKT